MMNLSTALIRSSMHWNYIAYNTSTMFLKTFSSVFSRESCLASGLTLDQAATAFSYYCREFHVNASFSCVIEVVEAGEYHIYLSMPSYMHFRGHALCNEYCLGDDRISGRISMLQSVLALYPTERVSLWTNLFSTTLHAYYAKLQVSTHLIRNVRVVVRDSICKRKFIACCLVNLPLRLLYRSHIYRNDSETLRKWLHAI
jgi:hypothetical protein